MLTLMFPWPVTVTDCEFFFVLNKPSPNLNRIHMNSSRWIANLHVLFRIRSIFHKIRFWSLLNVDLQWCFWFFFVCIKESNSPPCYLKQRCCLLFSNSIRSPRLIILFYYWEEEKFTLAILPVSSLKVSLPTKKKKQYCGGENISFGSDSCSSPGAEWN